MIFEKNINDISLFMKENKLKHTKIIEKSTFLYNDIISYEIKNNIVENIFITNKYEKNDLLLYNLNFKMKACDILSLLGEPDDKLGGKYNNISIIYYRLGLEIKFDVNNWNNPDAIILEIVYFKKKSVEYKCGVCKKVTKLICVKCKLIYYCNKNCQKNHWKFHKIFCK